MSRRVVVTGVGLLSSLGIGTDETWQGIRAARVGISRIEQFDAAAFTCRIAGEVKDFDPARFIEKKEIKKMGRFIQFGIAASEFALLQSGLKVDAQNAERVGVVIGSGIGGFEVIEREHRTLLEKGPSRISPFFIPATIINLASGYVSIRTGAKGPNSATATACTTSAHSIGDSFKIIQRDDADVMICGGAEACITPLGIGGFAAMRALSQRNDEPEKASRPWDADRDGFVVGEGSGILVLEELEHAKQRGATILAEIVGYGMSGDAFHITSPSEDGDGAFRVMRTGHQGRRHSARTDRLRQRARHLHRTGRSHRNHCHKARLLRSRLQAGRQFHQVHDRASARWRRRPRSRHHRARSARSDCAPHHQPAMFPAKAAIWTMCRITPAP